MNYLGGGTFAVVVRHALHRSRGNANGWDDFVTQNSGLNTDVGRGMAEVGHMIWRGSFDVG